ncbi:MAG: hypothetical protein IPK85_20555 [Gemmatimonadetes bacterium]|nr:hypothetical protein [Gemmatimonadota bacterium]
MLALVASVLLQPEVGLRLHQAADSLSVLRKAAQAQATFEGQRRQRLPVGWGAAGRCDVRVGRFCYWHDESSPRGPEEPSSISPLRAQLLATLGDAAALLPGDQWIAGQRVRYLVESGNHAGAREAARACQSVRWWCLALEGFADHAARDYSAAESAFDRALGAMDSTQRCQWADIRVLLPPASTRELDALDCAKRADWDRHRWALADPLWSVPGNDRRTEHFARHVMSELERVSRSPYHLSWGKDSHELMLRYGWPERWSRRSASGYNAGDVHVVGHEPHPAFQFFPGDSGLLAPERVAQANWDLRPADAVNRYAPAYASVAVVLTAQVARFERGDSLVLLTAVESPMDSAFDAATAIWTVATRDSAGVILVSALRPGISATTVPRAARWMSIEAVDSAHRAFARIRQALPVVGEPGLVLYRDPRPDDATLESVMPRMLVGARVRRSEPLGLYWEYDAGMVRESIAHVISVYPRSAPWLTRLARSLHLAEAAAPVHVRVAESPSSAAIPSRALALDLSALGPGVYDLRVRIEARGETVGDVRRTISVVR